MKRRNSAEKPGKAEFRKISKELIQKACLINPFSLLVHFAHKQVNFNEFKDVFVSLLTQSQLFNASTASYSDGVLEKDQFRAHSNSTNLNNCSPATGATEPHGKLGGYHQLAGDESSNRKTNGRTNQTSRRCKKSKKSTNFATSFKANDDNQENKHSNKHLNPQNGKKAKNRVNKNVNNNINNINISSNLDKDSNQDHHPTNRKNNLNDRLSSSKKMQRNSSSGTEEGYSSLDDCGSTSSANSCAIPESPDLIVALSNDEERGDHSNETKAMHHLHYRSHHHILVNNKKEDDNSDANQSDGDHLDLNSSDRSTVSSSDLNLMNNNEDLNSTAEEQQFQQQDEFEQSTEQYLSSIWQQLDVGKGGYLTLQELFIVCEHIQMPMDEAVVKQLFDRLDEDKDGKVSFDELLKQLTSSSTTGSDSVTNINSAASVLNENDYQEANIEGYANHYQSDYQLTNNNSSNMSTDKAMNEQVALTTNNTMNDEFDAEASSNKPGLSLALSPYSAYKNYFSSSSHRNESSFDKEATYDDEQSHLREIGDSVDHMTDANPFFSLDSKLLTSATGKNQRKSSFSAASAADCLNVSSSISSKPVQQANSLSCCCSTLNNQSKSDYGFTNGCSKVFCHKRTGSLGNAHPQTQHKHCNQYRNENCNELLSSSSNTSSANGSSVNPSSSANEPTVNQTLAKNPHHPTSSTLSAISERRPDLGELNALSCSAANCCCSSKTNKLLSENESGQGDGCSGKRGPIDKFSVNLSSRYGSSSSNQSTPEIEHTQLLSSLNSMHQFNSSHSYHHQTSSLTKEHHLQPAQQQTNDEDICNLTNAGFGNLLSLDPYNYG